MFGNVVVAVVASSVTQNETSDGGWSFIKGMGDGKGEKMVEGSSRAGKGLSVGIDC